MRRLIILAIVGLVMWVALSYNANAQSQNYIVDNVRGGVTVCNVQPVGGNKFVMCY